MNGSDLHFSTSYLSPEPTDASTVPGQLVVVSGPSGVGKSTIVEGLRTSWPFHFSVSVTTRPAREHERDGVDYRFVTREEFTNLIEAGALLEWAEYAEHLYGTPRAAVVDTPRHWDQCSVGYRGEWGGSGDAGVPRSLDDFHQTPVFGGS